MSGDAVGLSAEIEPPACGHGRTSLGSDDGIWWCDDCGAPTVGFRQINLSNRGGGPRMGDLLSQPTSTPTTTPATEPAGLSDEMEARDV